MTSGYNRTPTGLTDCEGRGKNTQYLEKGITDVYLAFRFETNLTSLVATSGVARVKNLD